MTLSLTITGQPDSKLKLAWRDDDAQFSPAAYCIGKNTVLDAGKEVRDVLTRLSTHFRTSDQPSYAEFLPELSQLGFVLYDSLFLPLETGQDAAEEVKQYIESLAERAPLTIYSDATAHVPWGFVFSQPAPIDKRALNGSISDFKDFWSSRFTITTRFTKSPFLKAGARRRNNFRVLYVLHKEAFQKARGQLSSQDQQCLDRLIRDDAGSVVDWNSAREKWRSIADNDSILYIFGHSNGKEIALSDGDERENRLSAGAFRANFKKNSGTGSATICFTNGCWTSVGDGDHSFLTATALPGFHGFIGSEAEVSNEFATRYGLEFMRALCDDGSSLQEAFEKLRHTLFPLSLLYSCYAHGKFQVERREMPPGHSHAA